MRRSVRVLRRAEHDLVEIVAWLERERPAAAGKVVDALLEGIEGLADVAATGASPHDEILRARGFRFVVVRSWLVFFRIRGAQVRVMRILHGKRDWLALLKRR